MPITAASPSPVAKREPTRELLEPTFQLRGLATPASSELNGMIGDAATVGWPLSPPPRLLLATCSSASSSPPATSSSASSLSELGAAAFPSKRGNWTRRLVITKQPLSEFYKDEGGKANALEVEVTLVEFNELGEPARSPDEEFIAIPLRILLFFESGKRVDDTDQEIFRFVGNDYDSVVIRAPTRKAAVQFRLEKVSRRKDGQRFKLRIEVDQEQCTANVADLTPIFTNAICVLSKRKHHSSYASDTSVRVKEPPPKLLKRDLTRMEEKLGEKIDVLMTQMTRMSQQLQKQNEIIAKHVVAVPPALHCSPSDANVTLEWLLKTNTADDAPWSRPVAGPQLYLNTAMPYFEVADEPYHGMETDLSSVLSAPPPTPSSDVNPVELVTSSLPFGEI